VPGPCVFWARSHPAPTIATTPARMLPAPIMSVRRDTPELSAGVSGGVVGSFVGLGTTGDG
jgi:hypothetical protein